MTATPHFDTYWDDLDRDLDAIPPVPTLDPLPLHSTGFATLYALHLSSVGPYRIFGYYSVPVGELPFPGLLLTPRYGSVNHIPDYNHRRRYAVLQIMHRGQRLADQPFSASYPGLLTLGIDDPETYVYRGIVADCLRAAEFLVGRSDVDRERIGIVGDDLALITAARRPAFSTLQFEEPMFYRMLEACVRTDSYPLEEMNDYLRAHPEDRDSVANTLALLDPTRHAPRVQATTLLSVGDPGSLTGPEWIEPLVQALGDRAERYTLTHEGGTDHDWQDAWMAAHLGVEPMTRFRRFAEPRRSRRGASTAEV